MDGINAGMKVELEIETFPDFFILRFRQLLPERHDTPLTGHIGREKKDCARLRVRSPVGLGIGANDRHLQVNDPNLPDSGAGMAASGPASRSTGR
jgi:hypothetical protein